MTNQNLEPDKPTGDAISDPAHDDTTGSDWSTEGGATETGPATDVARGLESNEDKGGKAGLAATLPLVIVAVLAILVVVWLVAR